MPALILSMPCKYSGGHSTPASMGRNLSVRPGKAPEETQTHKSNIPGKFANHQVVGKAGVSCAIPWDIVKTSASPVIVMGLLGERIWQ